MVLDVCAKRSSRITATSTCQEYVRQSHALAAFHPITARRSSVAFPCLCRFEQTFVIPSHFCRNLEKTFRTCADEHTRLEQRLPVQTPHIKRHTFKSNEHVSHRHNDNEAVRFRHRTCLRCKRQPKHSVIHSVRFEPILPAGCECVCVRAFATDCVDVCAGGCACHLMRHACVTVPLAGAASCEIAPAAGFCVSVLFVECHHEECSMSSSHRCGWPADGQAEKEQPRSRVTPARPWSPCPRDRGLRAPSGGVSPSFGAPASCNGWETGGQAEKINL